MFSAGRGGAMVKGMTKARAKILLHLQLDGS